MYESTANESATLAAPAGARAAGVHPPRIAQLAAICRARSVVRRVGGRFSLELGLDLEGIPEDVERWALAATLLGRGTSTGVALRAWRALERAGVRTVRDAGAYGAEALDSALSTSGYGEHRTALELVALADVLTERYEGRVATLGADGRPGELEQALGELPGWSPQTVSTFLRELRGIWPDVRIGPDRSAAAAARHLDLPSEYHGLAALAENAHLDARDLEAALVRLDLCHDFEGCPGGDECPFATLEPEQYVHF